MTSSARTLDPKGRPAQHGETGAADQREET
jgi:hypothetical protein